MTRKRYIPEELRGAQVAPGFWPVKGWNTPVKPGPRARALPRIPSADGEALQRWLTITPKAKP